MIGNFAKSARMIGNRLTPGFFPKDQWLDQNFDSTAVNVVGNNALPTAYVIPTKGIVLANFEDATVTEVPVAGKEISHGWNPGTALKPHFHLRKLSAGNGNAFFGFEYEFLSGTTLVEGELTKTVAMDGISVLNELATFSFDDVDMSAFSDIGVQASFRFYRDANNVADTFAGDIAIVTFGWHYAANSAGSRQVVTK